MKEPKLENFKNFDDWEAEMIAYGACQGIKRGLMTGLILFLLLLMSLLIF